MDLSSTRPWIVIPTYNEADNIADMVRAVRGAVPHAVILVVDDSSPDGTGDIVKSCMASDDGVQLLVRPAKQGLGAAYRDGFRKALEEGATAVVEIDADFSHDPQFLPSLLGELDKGAALAIGSRYVAGGRSPGLALSRLAISRLGNLYAAAMLGLSARDLTAGFRAYDARYLAKVDLGRIRADGYGFQVEMAYEIAQLGGVIAEVPIVFHDRRAGTSKMSMRIVVEAMILCTVWGVARRFPWMREQGRDDRLIEVMAMWYRRAEGMVKAKARFE